MAAASGKRRVRRGISVVGLGNWGSSLAAAVAASEIPLVEVVTRTAAKGNLSEPSVLTVGEEQAAFDAQFLWLSVPDREIAGIAERIVQRRSSLRGQMVLHSSGALPVSVLSGLREAGGRVGSIAPIHTFPTRQAVSLAGVLFAVESAEDADAARLFTLVRKLGGKPLRIATAKKALYHAGATMASPLLVSSLAAATEALLAAGLRPREAEAAVHALAGATMRNYFEEGREKSFSGAFARGDVATVELHLRALAEHPLLHSVYQALAKNAVASLPVRNRPGFKRIFEESGDSMNAQQRMRD